MLQPQGYYTLDELLDALQVPLPFLEEELELGMLSSSITMYGEPWYRQDHVYRWINRRDLEIGRAQAELRSLRLETIA